MSLTNSLHCESVLITQCGKDTSRVEMLLWSIKDCCIAVCIDNGSTIGFYSSLCRTKYSINYRVFEFENNARNLCWEYIRIFHSLLDEAIQLYNLIYCAMSSALCCNVIQMLSSHWLQCIELAHWLSASWTDHKEQIINEAQTWITSVFTVHLSENLHCMIM